MAIEFALYSIIVLVLGLIIHESLTYKVLLSILISSVVVSLFLLCSLWFPALRCYADSSLANCQKMSSQLDVVRLTIDSIIICIIYVYMYMILNTQKE
ncbi:hypothetical protein [Vibrio sinaloensis]|uniref:hypothetical protein n=1 Tax=Photobacterium sp. (strain ATCC 43367) TaxID=379097 RepID=UPI0022B0670E|nr:hypothetical protein [Vibrio sinaloensis]MCZ4296265.1 hypothetical protein [Vibrio sinaloensis]